MSKYAPHEIVELLRKFDSPTISNSIEKCQVRKRTEGYATAGISCRYPEIPPMVGYAVTCIAESTSPEATGPNRITDLFDAVASSPKPAVVVIQQRGPDHPRSCIAGDMVCGSWQKLGAVGLVTDAGVRDLSGIRHRAPGFQVFSGGIVVSHGLPIYLEVNVPVSICGLPIRPKDLLHGDESGVLSVPLEMVDVNTVVEKANAVLKRESDFFEFLNSDTFSLEQLKYRITH